MEFLKAFINLIKTVLGSGILYIPYLYKNYGIIYSTILLIFACILSSFGLIIYARCNDKINDKSSNIANFCEITFPELKKIVEFSIFLKCFGVATSYLIIIRDTITVLLYNIFPYEIFKNKKLGIIIFLLIIGPFTYYEKLNKLYYTSFIGVLAIIFVLISSIYRFFIMTFPIRKIIFLKPIEYSLLTKFGVFVFAFTCHPNLITIQNELRNNQNNEIQFLIYIVMGTSLIIYLIFGNINYLMFGDKLYDNVLINYPNDLLTDLMKIFYVLVMAFSFPLQINPCRKYFYSLINLNSEKNKKSYLLHIINTSILISIYFLTTSGLELGFVYHFIGSTASTFICLILPPLFLLKMNLFKNKIEVFFGLLMFIIGIFILLIIVTELTIH